MLEKDSEWIHPKNLKYSENVEKKKELKNPNTDFGSYALLNSDEKNSNIAAHNAVGDIATHFVYCLKNIIFKYNIPYKIIADMGAGAGFVAKAVKDQFQRSRVLTFEISADTVEYSKRNFVEVEAFVEAISSDSIFPTLFDLIYCKEFYPFTRTKSFYFQKEYIDLFLENLSLNGCLVISALATETSISSNLVTIRKEYPNCKIELQPSRLSAKLLMNSSFFLAQVLTRLQALITRQKLTYLIVIRK